MPSLLNHACRVRTTLVALLAAWALVSPLQAQHAARGGTDLRARMAEFLQSLPDDRGADTTRRFFPSSGDWSYTQTVHEENGGTHVERWVIPASQTSALFGFGKGVRVNPVRESFEIIYEGQKYGRLLDVIMHTPDRWRLVGRNRFVPPGAPASSPVYVEWRREGDTWVISAFGDAWFDPDRLPPWY
jgi:hypothetical protein